MVQHVARTELTLCVCMQRDYAPFDFFMEHIQYVLDTRPFPFSVIDLLSIFIYLYIHTLVSVYDLFVSTININQPYRVSY